MSEKNIELLGSIGRDGATIPLDRYNGKTFEDDHFAHARRIIASWPKWKQEIRIHPVRDSKDDKAEDLEVV